MSKRLKLSDLAKVVAKKAATSASKGVVISEGSETTSGKRALDDGSKGKQVAQSPEPKKARIDAGASGASARPPVISGAGSSARQVLSEALGPQASVMASAATVEKILAGVGLLSPYAAGIFAEGALNQKAVAESAEMEMVRAQNRAIELEGALAEEKAKGRKLAEDVDVRGKVISKLEARISDLEKSQSLTQGRIIAAFKESDDFLEAVRGSASSYFGDGFDFYKRQLAKQYPHLGVDLEDVRWIKNSSPKRRPKPRKERPKKRQPRRDISSRDLWRGTSSPLNGKRCDGVFVVQLSEPLWRASSFGAIRVEHQRTLSRRHVDGKFNAGQFESTGKWSNGGNDGFYTSEVGTSRDLGRWGRLITALPFDCLAVNKSTVPFMSFNTNLGGEESEQSLPSWISDHLGAKSYIDETNQPTSSLIPTNSSKMDTSSLTKESNVMSQADLYNLGTTYSFPQGVRLRIPGDGETILSARQGEVAFYEAAFLAGLRFPIHPTIRDILIHYQICPAQLSPNAWRSVICSLVIWRIFKRHLSCGEFRCLYSLSPLPDSGWYYFKARPEKNLLRGSPSNGKAATSCRLCPRLMEAVFGKIEPGGYFEVSKVLNSRTFKRHFAGGCSAFSTSGGDNTTSGDEGEFGTGEDSVEYLGVIRRGVGGAIRRALPGILDETLLRWLEGKVKDPFTNLLFGTSGSSSDSRSNSISNSELPPELRSDGKEGGGGQASHQRVVIREKRTREGDLLIEIGEEDSLKGKETVPPPPPKRFKSNRGAINARGRAAEAGTSSPAGDRESQSMSDASVAQRLLTGVIPASDKKEVDQLSENDLVAKSFHALGQVTHEILGVAFLFDKYTDAIFGRWSCTLLLSPSAARSISMISTFTWLARILPSFELVKAQKRAVKAETRVAELNEEISRPGTEVDDLKTTVAELTSKLAKAKELAIEDFKASEEFKAAVTDSAATYFGDGFEFCKRQFLHQFPNLGARRGEYGNGPKFCRGGRGDEGRRRPCDFNIGDHRYRRS
ncbi:hypothetical protein Acr_24g0008990 [Actinidia rufa]|uniref:Transposase (putative) gypsy type domain-containing protein n=1 Tax=Actinidia rufa TaxID=165716 RepID=A0A7J0GV33_9ERIC|nr:hypothetical protein Acr_24g0008990 [Actinidia rufa]